MSIDPIVQQLIDARVRAGRTQREVAAFAGIAQNTLSDAEAGKTEPRLGTLRRWAAALDLEPTLVGPGSTSPECVCPGDQRVSNCPVHAVAICHRCLLARSVSRCCSSHGHDMCHRCYRLTHFAEVCSEECARCKAENLPKILTGGPGSTSPEPGPATGGGIGCWPPMEEEFPDGPCERCRNRPSVGRCCSSHHKELCHRCYRITHFVEACSAGCERCAAEQLPPILTRERAAESTKDGTDGSTS